MKPSIRLYIQFLIVLIIGSAASFSQTRRPGRPGAPFLEYVKAYEETPYVTKVVLKNGMTVIVDEFKVQPVLSVQMHVRAGLFDEPQQSPGTAKLVSAIIDRGMPDKTAGSYRQKVQALGGIARSETDYSSSLFEIVAPSGQWKRALGVLAEAVQNPSFDPDAVKTEMRLVQGEAAGNLSSPAVYANEKLLELAFNQPRMAKNGSISRTLQGINPENLAAFYKAFYTPSRMMLVVSGDVSASEILNEVVRLYTRPAGPAAKPAMLPFSASQEGFRFSSIKGNTAVPHLIFAFRTVPENDTDFRPLQVLSAILGMGDASVLSARVRDEKKLVLTSQAELIHYPDFGYLAISAAADPSMIDKAEIGILTEIELLKREDPIEGDMERAFAQLERDYWSGLETVSGKAQALARFEWMGDWKRMDAVIAEIRKVKPADVKRMAGKYLTLQNCTLLEYQPVAAEDRRLTAESIHNTFTSLLTSAADEEQAKRNKQTVPAIKIPPPSNFKFNEVRYAFQTASILRGPALFIREDHSNALIEMGLFFPGGKLEEKNENSGITRLMTTLMLRGGEDAGQVYRQLETYGGKVCPVVTDDYFGVYLSVLSQNFEPALKLVLSSIRSATFDADDVGRQKRIQMAELQMEKTSNSYPRHLVRQIVFGTFPYSLDDYGSEAGLGSITPEALKAWYESHVRNRKPVVALIGDTKGTSLASVFVQNFSGSRFQDAKVPEGFAKPAEKGTTVSRDWDRRESLILLGFQAPPEDDEDGLAVAVLAAYSGDPGRFTQELRDRAGIAYRVSAEYQPQLRGGSFIVCAAAKPGSEDELVKALREEIQRVHDGPIPYRDFRSAVNEAVGAYNIRQQVRSEQIGAITSAALSGKGLEGFQNYPGGLQGVNEEDLKTMAQRTLNLEKASILVLRGKDNF